MICQDFDQVFYPILNAVRISQDFDQLSSAGKLLDKYPNLCSIYKDNLFNDIMRLLLQ